mmetsp:Transcript_8665/g.16049  ORF Transcript_8665/g.16049 Transcript_8665/m.16049 type:complete len:140 (-) Transcript_8665:717-1136(-)
MTMLKVSVIGDAFVDIFCPLLHGKLPFWGGDVLVDGVRTTCGGSASNTALQLASLVKGTEQWTVEFHTALGNDGWAGILKEKHDDLNCKLVNNTQDEGLTTGVCIVISGNSVSRILLVKSVCAKVASGSSVHDKSWCAG